MLVDVAVGVLKVRLIVRESHSLKDKRQVLRSIKDRLKNSFNISIAEVDEQENRQMIVLAVATVGNDNAHIRGVLEQIGQALRVHPVAEFVDQQMDVYAF